MSIKAFMIAMSKSVSMSFKMVFAAISARIWCVYTSVGHISKAQC